LVRNVLAVDLRRRLIEARRFASTGEDQDILHRAASDVAAYLRAASDGSASEADVGGSLEAAHASLERLVDVNVAQARAARVEAEDWGRAAIVIGVALAAVIMFVSLLLLWWLRDRAFRPILDLVDALDRFRTDRDARASETGPAELRQVAGHFNQMAAELARREQEKQVLIAGVAHDLRSPLQALQLALGQIDPDEPPQPEPRRRQLFGMATRQVDRLARMADDLLDTARADAGQLDIRPAPRDLCQLVRDVAELFHAASPAHSLDLVLPVDAVLVDCDEGRMAQVLDNLIQNAIKYSPGGGSVRIAIERGASDVTIVVADQGLGIPPEEQAAVFEPYRRGRVNRTTIPGAGLGLFVARRIVEAHGGRIDLASSPASGSTFRVLLPAPADDQRLSPA
jgi:signal transduction histidine kinase